MRRHGPRYVHDEGVHDNCLSRLNHTALALTVLRFAGRATLPPRKTRFRSLAKRYRTGLVTRGAAAIGFRIYIVCFLLLFQASWRKDIHN